METKYNILTLFENRDKGFFVPSDEVFGSADDNNEAYDRFFNDLKEKHPRVLFYLEDSYNVMAKVEEIGVWGIGFNFDYNLDISTGSLLTKNLDDGLEIPKVHVDKLYDVLSKLILYIDSYKSKNKYGVKVYEKDLPEYFDIINCETYSLEDYGNKEFILFHGYGSEFPCSERECDNILSFEDFKEMVIV